MACSRLQYIFDRPFWRHHTAGWLLATEYHFGFDIRRRRNQELTEARNKPRKQAPTVHPHHKPPDTIPEAHPIQLLGPTNSGKYRTGQTTKKHATSRPPFPVSTHQSHVPSLEHRPTCEASRQGGPLDPPLPAQSAAGRRGARHRRCLPHGTILEGDRIISRSLAHVLLRFWERSGATRSERLKYTVSSCFCWSVRRGHWFCKWFLCWRGIELVPVLFCLNWAGGVDQFCLIQGLSWTTYNLRARADDDNDDDDDHLRLSTYLPTSDYLDSAVFCRSIRHRAHSLSTDEEPAT